MGRGEIYPSIKGELNQIICLQESSTEQESWSDKNKSVREDSIITKELHLDGQRTSSSHFSTVYYFFWLSEEILSSNFIVRGFLQTFPPHCLDDSSLNGKYLVGSDDYCGSFQPYLWCDSVFPCASLNKTRVHLFRVMMTSSGHQVNLSLWQQDSLLSE